MCFAVIDVLQTQCRHLLVYINCMLFFIFIHIIDNFIDCHAHFIFFHFILCYIVRPSPGVWLLR